MALTNTSHSYGAVAKSLHWLTALLIVTLIPLGIIATNMPYDTSEALARKALLFSVHKTLGVVLFFVALVRIVWAITQPKPAPLHPERRLETLAAETVHWLLYGSLIVVPLSGWVHHAATTGFAPIWWPFGQSLPFVPKSDTVAETAAALHVIFERVLVLSLFLHIAGALKHRFVDRDETLARMLPGRVAGGPAHRPRGPVVPVALAVTVWATAVGIGAGLGLFHHDTTARAAEAPRLEQAAGDWQVQSGRLGISVTQLGNRVEGAFADWTAAISFDDSVTTGRAGAVRVEIAIASLTLGSVTAQALGADFLNAEGYPVAVFEADIERGPEGDIARGVLRLAGTDVPVDLPFDLTIDGDQAKMTGATVVNRLDFGVGESQDAGNLGLEVDISVALEATRSE